MNSSKIVCKNLSADIRNHPLAKDYLLSHCSASRYRFFKLSLFVGVHRCFFFLELFEIAYFILFIFFLSGELSFIWDKRRTAAREAASQIALRDFSKAALGESQYIRLWRRRSSIPQSTHFTKGFLLVMRI